MSAKRVVVVGAGSAGCVVAARLSESPEVHVTLLESGSTRHDVDPIGQLESVNWIDALGVPTAFDQELLATRLREDAPRLYHRGRCLGGSGSVNAMLALPGLPQDYDAWAQFGIEGWSWADVEPTFARLRDDLVRSGDEELTPVDLAVMDAADAFELPTRVDTYTPDDGGGPLYRNASRTHRRSSLETYLEPALERQNLEVRTGAPVSRVETVDGRASAVVLVDGQRIEADEIVLCAGTIETPAILMRSGLGGAGVGNGLQDHPAASFYLKLRSDLPSPDPTRPCIGAVLRLPSSEGAGDIHLLPVHGTLGESDPVHDGVLMAAVMSVTSTGTVRLNADNPDGPPVIAENMLSTDRDRRLMIEAVTALERVLATAPFTELIEAAFIDRNGTPVEALREPGAFESWLNLSIGDYFHAVGTARMGREDDEMAVVDSNGCVYGIDHLTVIDASIIPLVPRANTHLPVVMVAERLAQVLTSRLHEATQGASA